jgi:hypothetical protein
MCGVEPPSQSHPDDREKLARFIFRDSLANWPDYGSGPTILFIIPNAKDFLVIRMIAVDIFNKNILCLLPPISHHFRCCESNGVFDSLKICDHLRFGIAKARNNLIDHVAKISHLFSFRNGSCRNRTCNKSVKSRVFYR